MPSANAGPIRTAGRPSGHSPVGIATRLSRGPIADQDAVAGHTLGAQGRGLPYRLLRCDGRRRTVSATPRPSDQRVLARTVIVGRLAVTGPHGPAGGPGRPLTMFGSAGSAMPAPY